MACMWEGGRVLFMAGGGGTVLCGVLVFEGVASGNIAYPRCVEQ